MKLSTSVDDAYGFIINARTSYSAPSCMYAPHGSPVSAATSGAAIISSAIPITRFIVSPFDGIILHAMARDLPIGNGNRMANFDHEYNIRDVYYPHLGGNAIGDTIFFDPEFNGFVAYKAQRYVLINGSVDDQFGFQSFAIGTKEREGYQGTWRDAEDGVLEAHKAIAQGSVDCT